MPSGAAAEPSPLPVASSPIAAQAYSGRGRRLSPSLANRLRIGFAIGFAVLTAMAVIGVGRFIQQRQDFEDAIARSYQVEIAARGQLARGTTQPPAAPTVAAQAGRRAELRDQISSDTRDTALLVAAGLIAGLTGALLLFSGLIASMRRPLEELVDAAGRLAGGDRSARVEVGGLSETATLGAAFNEMADELEQEASQRDQLDRLKDEFVLTASHELRSPLTSVQGFAELLMLERDTLTPQAGGDGRDHPRQLPPPGPPAQRPARPRPQRRRAPGDHAGADRGRAADRGRGADDAGPDRGARDQTLSAADRAGSAAGRRRGRPDSPSTGESAYQRA